VACILAAKIFRDKNTSFINSNFAQTKGRFRGLAPLLNGLPLPLKTPVNKEERVW